MGLFNLISFNVMIDMVVLKSTTLLAIFPLSH